MKQLVSFIVPWLCLGCYAAPRQVSLTLDLSPQSVSLVADLRDVRTPALDPLTQLRAFDGVKAWSAADAELLPWAPAPSAFVYASDGGQLDLEVRATMAREPFDACARSVDGGCPRFPLRLAGGRYGVVPEVLDAVVLDPGQATSWPADAGRVTFRFALREASAPLLFKPNRSLAAAFLLHRSDSRVAAETVARVNELEAAFELPLAEWKQQLEREGACSGEPWCQLRADAIEGARLRLVHEFLSGRPEGGYGIQPPPPQFGWRHHDGGPKWSLPLVDELRLRVEYDLQLAEFHRTGHPRPTLRGWGAACASKKQAEARLFCSRLGAKP